MKKKEMELLAQEIFNEYGSALSVNNIEKLKKIYGTGWDYIKSVYQGIVTLHNEVAPSAKYLLGGVDLSTSNEKIIEILLKKFQTPEIILTNAPWLSKYLGYDRFALIRNVILNRFPNTILPQELRALPENLPGIDPPVVMKKHPKPIAGGVFEFYNASVDRIFVENGQTFYAVTFRRGEAIKRKSVRALDNDKHQYKAITVAYNHNRDIIRIDEYWAYKNLYEVGSEYLFTVDYAVKAGDKKYRLTLKDKNGLTQSCTSTKYFDDGQQICCTVVGFQKTKDHAKCLILSNPRNYIKPGTEESSNTGRIIYFGWYEKLHLYRKHICGKVAVCSCCKRTFEFKRGYRFEEIDEYLCMECYEGIFPKTAKKHHKEWVRFINTNMGHKK